MKSILRLFFATALLLSATSFAAPIESSNTNSATPTSSDPSTNSSGTESDAGAAASPDPQTVALAWGTPQCKSKALYDLCTSNNAGAYCDAQGFHCNFMASCRGVCFCEPN
ncbi:hypothetical protein B0T17DRAFT_194987 [Bombardia bombarda]|uniref:Uncharacterized protein n=1 Tax=Bombardia bombarda TaxID=252184 RepID=A0AA40C9N6_9PEZI|nr:hypothetical protein B0T17DRAFT_194987 [Bombardia bombarda]